MAMIAMTTSNSIRVNPARSVFERWIMRLLLVRAGKGSLLQRSRDRSTCFVLWNCTARQGKSGVMAQEVVVGGIPARTHHVRAPARCVRARALDAPYNT